MGRPAPSGCEKMGRGRRLVRLESVRGVADWVRAYGAGLRARGGGRTQAQCGCQAEEPGGERGLAEGARDEGQAGDAGGAGEGGSGDGAGLPATEKLLQFREQADEQRGHHGAKRSLGVRANEGGFRLDAGAQRGELVAEGEGM